MEDRRRGVTEGDDTDTDIESCFFPDIGGAGPLPRGIPVAGRVVCSLGRGMRVDEAETDEERDWSVLGPGDRAPDRA